MLRVSSPSSDKCSDGVRSGTYLECKEEEAMEEYKGATLYQ